MKKRCMLLSFLLAFSMLLGACGVNDPFAGKWTGKLDVTKQFEDGIKEKYPELAEFVDFEELVFVIDVVFEDAEMSMAVEQSSVDSFYNNFADGMLKIEEGCRAKYLESIGLTLEEAAVEAGMTEEEYLENVISTAMPVDEMVTSLTEITDTAMVGFNKVNGTYTFNEKALHVHYEDEKYEEIVYQFEGDNLVLVFEGVIGDQEFSLRIVCEK